MKLASLREKIDAINAEIIALCAARLEIAKEIAKVKRKEKLPIHDPQREEEQREKIRALASQHGLNPAVIEEIFALLIEYTKLKEKMEYDSPR